MTSISYALLLLATTGITSTVAQKGTVPKETCQFLTYNFEHGFIEDPMVNISTLVGPNNVNLERLKQFIIVDEACSVATELKVFKITYNKGLSVLNLPTITQRIKIQVSAQINITSPTEKSTKLHLCLESVTRRVGSDTQLANSVPLNSTVNGIVNGLIRSVTIGRESCCQAIYGFPGSICCRPGFIEDGDNCACSNGKFLNLTNASCDDCPEDTYQPNNKTSNCLSCPKGSTTNGTTGANSILFCLKACPPGSHHVNKTHECSLCEKGKYQNKSGQDSCKQCLEDKITLQKGSTRSEDCLTACPPGSHHVNRTHECSLCEKDKYQSKRGQETCNKCLEDKITLQKGSTKSEDCLAACPPGSHHVNKTHECSLCEKGKYQNKWGQETCNKCSEDKITLQKGSTRSEDCFAACPPGSHHVKKTHECSLCEKDKYQNAWGQETCNKCLEDKITLQKGSTKSADCFKACPPGSHHVNKTHECRLCEMDEYQKKLGQETCTKCSEDKITLQKGSNKNEDCFTGFVATTTKSSGESLKSVVPALSTIVVLLVCMLVIWPN